jgi:DNA-binding NarL/FixJ family response regulator
MPIKVVVADDKAAVRLGIVQMLKTDTDLEVAGEASTFAEALEVVDSLKPDIVVLDLHMPDEENYLPESVKLQVLEHAGCILTISVWNDSEAKALSERFGAEAFWGPLVAESGRGTCRVCLIPAAVWYLLSLDYCFSGFSGNNPR